MQDGLNPRPISFVSREGLTRNEHGRSFDLGWHPGTPVLPCLIHATGWANAPRWGEGPPSPPPPPTTTPIYAPRDMPRRGPQPPSMYEHKTTVYFIGIRTPSLLRWGLLILAWGLLGHLAPVAAQSIMKPLWKSMNSPSSGLYYYAGNLCCALLLGSICCPGFRGVSTERLPASTRTLRGCCLIGGSWLNKELIPPGITHTITLPLTPHTT
jgi:hypothetical protein